MIDVKAVIVVRNPTAKRFLFLAMTAPTVKAIPPNVKTKNIKKNETKKISIGFRLVCLECTRCLTSKIYLNKPSASICPARRNGMANNTPLTIELNQLQLLR